MRRKVEKNAVIANDINRYKRNTFPGNLALFSIIFECLYFMFLYKLVAGDIQQLLETGKPIYTVKVGISVVLNLVLLLTIFLTSEEIKGYNKKFCIVAFVVAGIQILRIFGLPLEYSTQKFQFMENKVYMDAGTFTALLIFLVASAALLIAAGVIGIITSNNLNKFQKQLESGEIDLEAELKSEPVIIGEVAIAESAAEPAEETVAEQLPADGEEVD